MSHGITINDQLAYLARNGTPWHKLGIALDRNQTAIETAPQAFADRKNGGIWEPVLYQAAAINDLGHVVARDANRFAIARPDSGEIFGYVSSRYALRGPAHFCRFLDSLRPEGVNVDVLGSLSGGAKLFCSLNIGQNWTVRRFNGQEDAFKTQLLAITGIDGATAWEFIFSDIRAVCANTVQMAFGSGHEAAKAVRHTVGCDDRLAAARETILAAMGQKRTQIETLQELDASAMDRAEFVRFTLALLRSKASDPVKAREESEREFADANERIKARTEKAIGDFLALFEGGIGNYGQTRYDALNAVTQHVDREKAKGKKGAAVAKAAMASVFGAGSDLKGRALNLLTRW